MFTTAEELLRLAATPDTGAGDPFTAAIGRVAQLAERVGDGHIETALHLGALRGNGAVLTENADCRAALWIIAITADYAAVLEARGLLR